MQSLRAQPLSSRTYTKPNYMNKLPVIQPAGLKAARAAAAAKASTHYDREASRVVVNIAQTPWPSTNYKRRVVAFSAAGKAGSRDPAAVPRGWLHCQLLQALADNPRCQHTNAGQAYLKQTVCMVMRPVVAHHQPAHSVRVVQANWVGHNCLRTTCQSWTAAAAAGDAAAFAKPESGKSNYWDCTFALTKAIIGAGGADTLRLAGLQLAGLGPCLLQRCSLPQLQQWACTHNNTIFGGLRQLAASTTARQQQCELHRAAGGGAQQQLVA